ncbi:aspartate/glutamate racemase family protein [Leptothrix discophora]|uniref:Aspartate/glutamate racemase family protein n=1 Tax=Leptothrix discophora TaxID=89 RepID=A0ABT9G786_LEPDI|nr:aspartate/glutamate racemase family protein [Leptothrix discophora]MDP4302349.1 aspartate/glutamate racemase family protein [Leptothrix discophora]
MRLLVINPNISTGVTALIEAEARRSAEPGTALTLRTAPFGVAYIETRFEALIGAYAAAQLAAEDHAGHDAVIVAAFGDPGVAALREVLPVPVIGLTESALSTALLLGRRVSVIAISQRIQAWYREVIRDLGQLDRLASIRALDQALGRIDRVGDAHADVLLALCERAVHEDGAEVLILAGAPLAGLSRQLEGRLPVPVVDGVSCAVRQAQSLVRQRPGPALAGGGAPPPLKPNAGLPDAMARLLADGAARTQAATRSGDRSDTSEQ